MLCVLKRGCVGRSEIVSSFASGRGDIFRTPATKGSKNVAIISLPNVAYKVGFSGSLQRIMGLRNRNWMDIKNRQEIAGPKQSSTSSSIEHMKAHARLSAVQYRSTVSPKTRARCTRKTPSLNRSRPCVALEDMWVEVSQADGAITTTKHTKSSSSTLYSSFISPSLTSP